MKIHWLDKAVTDLKTIHDYISQDNVTAACKTATAIVKQIEMLADHPALGRAGRVNNTRELVINHAPYIVPYRIQQNTVQILRIFHSAMQWPKQL